MGNKNRERRETGIERVVVSLLDQFQRVQESRSERSGEGVRPLLGEGLSKQRLAIAEAKNNACFLCLEVRRPVYWIKM